MEKIKFSILAHLNYAWRSEHVDEYIYLALCVFSKLSSVIMLNTGIHVPGIIYFQSL